MNFSRPLTVAAAVAWMGALDATRAAGADAPKHGYTVTVELKVDEKGAPQEERVAASEDRSPDHYLDVLALAMASKTKFPPHKKDGVAVSYTVKAPFFFPIEDDQGAEADSVPKPKLREVTQPVYPQTLRDGGIVGGVILEIAVDAEGKLAEVKTLRASRPEFEAAATESVKKWQFAPAQKDGKAVGSLLRLAIVFDTETDKADLKWRVPPRPSLGTFIVMKPAHPIPVEATEPAASEQPAGAAQPAPAAEKPEAGK